MLLLILTACRTELAEEDVAPMEELVVGSTVTQPTTTLPAFVEPKPEPRVERFTLETYHSVTSAGQTPPPCHYLARFNQFGGYTTEMDDGPGVAWDLLVVPFLDTVTVTEDGDQYTLVKVLVPDFHYGQDEWVQVNWFPAEAFVDSPDQAPYFGETVEPTVPGTCTMPPQPVKAVAMEATLTVKDPSTGATSTFEGVVQPGTVPTTEAPSGKAAPQP